MMKKILFSLLFVTIYHQSQCRYRLSFIAHDFRKTYKSFKKYFRYRIKQFINYVKAEISKRKNQAVSLSDNSEAVKSENLNNTVATEESNNILNSNWTKGVNLNSKFDVSEEHPLQSNETNKLNLNITDQSNLPKSNIPNKPNKAGKLFQLTSAMLSQWHGREMETHIVQTKDGFLLTVHRLPRILKVYSNNRRTILIHHGLLGSSIDWILLGPNNVLPYLLSDAGYDVWLMNARGNFYSRGHEHLTVSDPTFWNFTFDEMGLIDIPAVIDYMMIQDDIVLPLDFVGYSMGATAFLVFLSSVLSYKSVLRVGVLIAPLAFMSNVSGPLKMLTEVPEEMLRALGSGEILPNRKVPRWLAQKYCDGPMNLCSNPLWFLSGLPSKRAWNAVRTIRVQDHVPAGGSINTILHYIQLAKTKKFHKFNRERKEYNILNIETPIALISSDDDWLASVNDVQSLYNLLQNPIDHSIIFKRNVSHTDFLWDSTISVVVFQKVLRYLDKAKLVNSIKTDTHS